MLFTAMPDFEWLPDIPIVLRAIPHLAKCGDAGPACAENSHTLAPSVLTTADRATRPANPGDWRTLPELVLGNERGCTLARNAVAKM